MRVLGASHEAMHNPVDPHSSFTHDLSTDDIKGKLLDSSSYNADAFGKPAHLLAGPVNPISSRLSLWETCNR